VAGVVHGLATGLWSVALSDADTEPDPATDLHASSDLYADGTARCSGFQCHTRADVGGSDAWFYPGDPGAHALAGAVGYASV